LKGFDFKSTENVTRYNYSKSLELVIRPNGKLVVELDYSLFVVQNEWFCFYNFLSHSICSLEIDPLLFPFLVCGPVLFSSAQWLLGVVLPNFQNSLFFTMIQGLGWHVPE